MGKCLIEIYPEAVNDSSLRKVGELRIDAHLVDNPDYTTNGTQRFEITSAVTQALNCLDDGHFTNGSGVNTGDSVNISAGSNTTLVCENKDFQISVANKYELTYLRFRGKAVGIDLEDLYACNKITTLLISQPETKGDLLFVKDLPLLTNLSVMGSKVVGNIANLNPYLTAAGIGAKGIYGHLKSIGNHTSLTSISLTDTQVTGSIEEFAAAQVAAGRTSGTITMALIRSLITYNGVLANANKTVTFSSSLPNGYSVS